MTRGRWQGTAPKRRRWRPGLAGVPVLAAMLAGCTPGVPGPPPLDAASLAQDCAVSTLPEPVLPAVAGDADFPAGYDESCGRFRADCSMLEAKGLVACGHYPLAVNGEPDLTASTPGRIRPMNGCGA